MWQEFGMEGAILYSSGKSQSFIGPALLGCGLHKHLCPSSRDIAFFPTLSPSPFPIYVLETCLLVTVLLFLFVLLTCDRNSRVSWNGVGSKTLLPGGMQFQYHPMVKVFPGKEDFVTEQSSSSPARARRAPFSDPHFESLVEFLEGKLILGWRSTFDCGPQEFLTLMPAHI